MENINIGIVKSLILNKLSESYLNNDSIDETKGLASKFFDIVKNSPILKLELRVFEGLEKKNIENDLIATRYIDNNIKLFEKYSFEDLKKEHEKLYGFLTDNLLKNIDSDKNLLFESINNLILQSVCNCDDVDIDLVHESFETVLNHIKKPKNQIIESVNIDLDDNLIELAINKFNKKYDPLLDEDKFLLKKLIETSIEEKKNLLKSYKTKNIEKLEFEKLQNVEKEGIEEKINESIEKINNIIFNPETINDDIVDLHELNKKLNKVLD